MTTSKYNDIILYNSFVTKLEIVNSGIGYSSSPKIKVYDTDNSIELSTIVDYGGYGAKASIRIEAGSVQYIEIINGGYGYTTEPVINLISPTQQTGYGASFKTTLQNGSISNIIILSNGNNYPDDTYVIIGGQITSINTDFIFKVYNSNFNNYISNYYNIEVVGKYLDNDPIIFYNAFRNQPSSKVGGYITSISITLNDNIDNSVIESLILNNYAILPKIKAGYYIHDTLLIDNLEYNMSDISINNRVITIPILNSNNIHNNSSIILTGGYSYLFKNRLIKQSIIQNNITIEGIIRVYRKFLL